MCVLYHTSEIPEKARARERAFYQPKYSYTESSRGARLLWPISPYAFELINAAYGSSSRIDNGFERGLGFSTSCMPPSSPKPTNYLRMLPLSVSVSVSVEWRNICLLCGDGYKEKAKLN